MRKVLLSLLGWLFIGTGVVGIFVPLLPTTCFLIAAVWCFVSSSPKTLSTLKQHALTGPVLNKISPKFLPHTN